MQKHPDPPDLKSSTYPRIGTLNLAAAKNLWKEVGKTLNLSGEPYLTLSNRIWQFCFQKV